jgi:hypothetical protein
MEQVRITVPLCEDDGGAPAEERVAPRFTLLIRSAKVVGPQGEFICVIRDVSTTGISLRGFHDLPRRGPLRIELQTGETHAIEEMWRRGNEAGFRFVEPVEVHDLIAEAGHFPKRQLRLAVNFPVTISAALQLHRGELTNVSQQGARIESPSMFAIDQPLRIVSDRMPELVARVRWRREGTYGVVFDNTFSLSQLALFAASLQAPELLARSQSAAARGHG